MDRSNPKCHKLYNGIDTLIPGDNKDYRDIETYDPNNDSNDNNFNEDHFNYEITDEASDDDINDDAKIDDNSKIMINTMNVVPKLTAGVNDQHEPHEPKSSGP